MCITTDDINQRQWILLFVKGQEFYFKSFPWCMKNAINKSSGILTKRQTIMRYESKHFDKKGQMYGSHQCRITLWIIQMSLKLKSFMVCKIWGHFLLDCAQRSFERRIISEIRKIRSVSMETLERFIKRLKEMSKESNMVTNSKQATQSLWE